MSASESVKAFRARRARVRSLSALQLGTLGTALYMLSVATVPSRADASIFGEENAVLGAILAENIKELAEAAKTVQGIATQIEQLRVMIRQSETMLKQVGSGNLVGLRRLLETASRAKGLIDRDIKFISYKLGSVDREREAVYQDSLRGADPSTFRAKSLTWNGALMESSRVAMRAQTNVSELEGRTQTVTDILQDSQGAQGIVGQLQLVVQSLAVLHADLAGIQRSLDTGMRVTANVAAQQAASAAMVEEQRVLSMDNYTDPGPAVPVSRQLPRFE